MTVLLDHKIYIISSRLFWINCRYRRMSSETDQATKKCNCTEGCSKHSCSCNKDGSKCNSSCGCHASCQNILNHLDYFFGENSQCSANLCFSHWLMQKVNNVEDLQTINRDTLRKRIRNSSM